LLVIHEADGSWAIHGLGAPGVRLTVLSSRRSAGSPIVDGADHG
jgi:hypothetical protein